MFEISQNMGEFKNSEQKAQNDGREMESFNQNLNSCPTVLTGMSREMRNQLNAIVSLSFLLNKSDYNETERKEFGNQIFECCEMIINLFDNFLDSTLIDTSNSKTEPVNCNPEKTFNELFIEFREILKKETYKELILVTESRSVNTEEYLIDADILIRVIRNLFQNALKNTKSGYIKMGYYFSNELVTFYSLDSGDGYNKCKEFLQTQDLTRSLARFNDVSSAVNLALTRKLIQSLNGSLWIESNGLTGCGIYFSIPVVAVAKPDNSTGKQSNTMITI